MRVIVPGERVKVTNHYRPIPTRFDNDGRLPYVAVSTTPEQWFRSLFVLTGLLRHGNMTPPSQSQVQQALLRGGWPCES